MKAVRKPGQETAAIARSWAGGFVLSGDRGLYRGPVFVTDTHAHHAVQVCVGLRGGFRLRTGPASPWREWSAAIVRSDAPHELDGGGSLMALLYLDPDTARVRSLAETWPVASIFAPPPEVAAALVRRLCEGAERKTGLEQGLRRLCDDAVDVLGGCEVAGVPLEPRIERALAVLRDAPDRHMSAADLSRTVGLSPGRLAHLFRRHAGLPVRRYLLWLRLADALREIMRGASLTHAAHAAGFADSAHLSRTFRRMFGLAPSVFSPAARRLEHHE